MLEHSDFDRLEERHGARSCCVSFLRVYDVIVLEEEPEFRSCWVS